MGEETADLNAPAEALRTDSPELLLGADRVRLAVIVCERIGNAGRRDDVLLRTPKPGYRILRPNARDDVPSEQCAALGLSVRVGRRDIAHLDVAGSVVICRSQLQH